MIRPVLLSKKNRFPTLYWFSEENVFWFFLSSRNIYSSRSLHFRSLFSDFLTFGYPPLVWNGKKLQSFEVGNLFAKSQEILTFHRLSAKKTSKLQACFTKYSYNRIMGPVRFATNGVYPKVKYPEKRPRKWRDLEEYVVVEPKNII